MRSRRPKPNSAKPPKSFTIIYGVCDPRTSQLRYVGKTRGRLTTRLYNHLRVKDKTHRSNWFSKMEREKVLPEIFEIEVVQDWREAERFWIAYFRSIGCKLVNTTFGGDGLSGAGPTSFKRGQKAWNEGKTYGAETRAKIAAANRARVHPKWSEEHKLRHKETMKRVNPGGKPWTQARWDAFKNEDRHWKVEDRPNWKATMDRYRAEGWSPSKGKVKK